MRHALSLAVAVLASPIAASETLDPTPRLAVVSAFAPEWVALTAALDGPETHSVRGTRFVTGALEGQDVVLFLSGIGMVNAAMTAQLALERFDITGVVFSGIAGGVDPDLAIGDVVVPAQWGQYLLSVFARETADGWAIPPFFDSTHANFGMMHPIATEVTSARTEEPEQRFWFPVDDAWLATAEAIAPDLALGACNAEGACLSDAPSIVVGGNGVSGAAFVDNADYRAYVFDAFDARVLDMESAAVAHVAYVAELPFIAFRSLSDLAGGGDSANELPIFFGLAADNSAAVVRAFLAALD